METRRFDATNLPSLKDGTNGYALPKPGVPVAACAVPVDATMTTPWGQELQAKAGKHWHLCQDAAKGDHYPNDEFERFYTLGSHLGEDDPNAAFLTRYWQDKGFAVQVYSAEKTKPALVVGVTAEDGIFVNEEGEAPFEAGDVILGSPEIARRMWLVKAAAFTKKYQGIIPGLPQ